MVIAGLDMGTLASGVLASVVAALLFLILMTCIRPRLAFSGEIARHGAGDGKCFRFKVVNRSLRAAVDIKLQLLQVRVTQAPNGPVNFLRPIPLKLSDGVMLLPGWRPRDKEHRNARRVRIDEDLDDTWDGDTTYLVLRCYATDSTSNFGRQFEQRYHRPDSAIVNGTFEVGRSMAIK